MKRLACNAASSIACSSGLRPGRLAFSVIGKEYGCFAWFRTVIGSLVARSLVKISSASNSDLCYSIDSNSLSWSFSNVRDFVLFLRAATRETVSSSTSYTHLRLESMHRLQLGRPSSHCENRLALHRGGSRCAAPELSFFGKVHKQRKPWAVS